MVEDDEGLRFLAAEVLAILGMQVIAACTADAASKILLRTSDIHLVFTDIQMPGEMAGLGLAHWIWLRWPDLPVLLTSGNVSIKESLSSCRFFLQKRGSIEDLHAAAASLLAI